MNRNAMKNGEISDPTCSLFCCPSSADRSQGDAGFPPADSPPPADRCDCTSRSDLQFGRDFHFSLIVYRFRRPRAYRRRRGRRLAAVPGRDADVGGSSRRRRRRSAPAGRRRRCRPRRRTRPSARPKSWSPSIRLLVRNIRINRVRKQCEFHKNRGDA